METFIQEVNQLINELENKGFNCGKLTTKEKIKLFYLLKKSM